MKIDKKLNFLAGIGVGILLGCIIVGATVSTLLGKTIFPSKQEAHYSTLKVKKISYFLKRFHVNLVNEKKLREKIFSGYIYGIGDSDTIYLDKNAYKSYQLNQEGKNIGVGIEIVWGISEQYLWVTEVMKNSPADKNGVKVGDKIIKIDGTRASASNQLIMSQKFKAALGDKHIFTIEDKDTKQIKEIELKAEVLNIESLTSDILDNNVGYIKINAILEQTAKDLEKQLAEFETKNINKVILDIRGTNSSNIDWTKEVCDVFLDEGICFSVMDHEGKLTEYHTQNGKYEGEIIVLIDAFTSGTLEGFAAAIQDHNRGKIIGTTTQAQATIQTFFDLKDGTGLLISTGKLYTPKGIENKGVQADVVVYTSYDEIIGIIEKGIISIEQDHLIQAGIEYLTQKAGK